MAFLKDDPALVSAPLTPASPIAVPVGGQGRALALVHNRIGGLVLKAGAKANIPEAAALAAWHVESGGAPFEPGAAILRLEAHVLFEEWGGGHAARYDTHFQHGGRPGVPGEPWQNHKYRRAAGNDFRVYHGDQDKEYKALAVAIDLAGEETAYRAASIGGPQILMRGHSLVGYPSAKTMYQAFQASERAHVLGFFDFCLNKLAPGKGDLAAYMRDRNWKSLARYYNGPGQVDIYAPRFKSAYETAVSLGL